jgi:hypothetical protein
MIRADNEKRYQPVPPGMHLARCYRIIDLGTQPSDRWGNKPKLMMQWEVHSEDDAGNLLVTSKGEPMTISKNYTVSLSENATLRKDLATWRGRDFTSDELKGFELGNVLGHWAMISVGNAMGNNGKEYTNITTINPVPPNIKKQGLPDGHNKTQMFVLNDPDMEIFESFSDGLKAKIEKSPEWQSRRVTHAPRPVAGEKYDIDDDLPF